MGNPPSEQRFRVALTADFYDADQRLKYHDIGLDLLSDSGIEITRLRDHRPILEAEQLRGLHGVIVLSPRVTAESLVGNEQLVAIGRFGVGYDSVDVAACTEANIVLFITAGAVDHSVAEATVAWMLALTHHVRIKDQLVRANRWDQRSQFMGAELRGRTLGVIGFGGIGRALVRLLAGFGMKRPLVYDPYVESAIVNEYGATAVPLDTLLEQSDFVSLHCPLNDRTRNLLTARELARMKPTAFLINTARGGIVDEDALYDALRERRIAGAALDCFAIEPPPVAPRVAELENVLLAPHSIAWTHELFRDIGRAVCRGILELAAGRPPHGVVNPEVLERPEFQEKLRRAPLRQVGQ